VRHPKKLAPEEVLRAWVRELNKEGVAIDAKKFMPQKGPRPFLPKRWIVERTFSWLSEQEAEQGLREAAGKRRSLYLRSYEPPDGQEIGSLMRLFGQFQHEVRRIPLPRTRVNKGKKKGRSPYRGCL
jgi:hypothetical protein